MKLIYLKSAWKCDSFDAAIGIKIPFFRVLVTIEPGPPTVWNGRQSEALLTSDYCREIQLVVGEQIELLKH